MSEERAVRKQHFEIEKSTRLKSTRFDCAWEILQQKVWKDTYIIHFGDWRVRIFWLDCNAAPVQTMSTCRVVVES